MHLYDKRLIVLAIVLFMANQKIWTQETKLLRQPSISTTHATFTYGSDVWVSDLNGQNVKRITSTAAIESNPVISPDGTTIALTSPDNAIFDPEKNEWIAENEGIAPDIEVRIDLKSLVEGRDPQLERAVEELMKMIDEEMLKIERPVFSKPANNKN